MLFSTPQRAALISVASNTLLVAAKIAVAVASASAALLSEALHSGLDLLAALIAWLSLRFAAHPPDREHPYGHGKWENISAFLEGLLILGGGPVGVLRGRAAPVHPGAPHPPASGHGRAGRLGPGECPGIPDPETGR